MPFSTFKVFFDEDSKEWTFKTSTIMKKMTLKFKLDEEFDEKTPDGRRVVAVVNKDGDTFTSIQTAKKEGEKSTKAIREFKDDEMIQTIEVIGTDTICTQVFKRK